MNLHKANTTEVRDSHQFSFSLADELGDRLNIVVLQTILCPHRPTPIIIIFELGVSRQTSTRGARDHLIQLTKLAVSKLGLEKCYDTASSTWVKGATALLVLIERKRH